MYEFLESTSEAVPDAELFVTTVNSLCTDGWTGNYRRAIDLLDSDPDAFCVPYFMTSNGQARNLQRTVNDCVNEAMTNVGVGVLNTRLETAVRRCARALFLSFLFPVFLCLHYLSTSLNVECWNPAQVNLWRSEGKLVRMVNMFDITRGKESCQYTKPEGALP